MSVCGEFAEHVWKPGSCKNCFYPRSAHANAKARRSEEEEGDGASPSPYSKPTIAVKPTMMNMDAVSTSAELNSNTPQDAEGQLMGRKNRLDLSPLLVDSSSCSKSLKEALLHSVSPSLDYCSRVAVSPHSFLNSSSSISSIFITQEENRNTMGLKENLNSDPYSPPLSKTPNCTYITSCDSFLNEMSNKSNNETSSVMSSPAATPEPCINTDSRLHASSTDSLSGPDPFQSEPVYAESAKRKPRCRRNGEAEFGKDVEGQRATITVMAAHTEENNRTFYLSSPDSAVSTQWRRFSPTHLEDPCSPAFSWPSSPVTTETPPLTAATPKQSECKSSPPVPPKRTTRSPKLGASSLSPLPLPELNFNVTLPPKLTQGDAHSSCPVLSSSWRTERRSAEEERREEEKNGGEESEWRDECESTPGTDDPNNSASQKRVGVRTGIITGKPSSESSSSSSGGGGSSDPRPPLPPPKKHHRSCMKLSGSSMDLDQRGSVESLPHSLNINMASSESLLSDSGIQELTQRSCPSLPLSPTCLRPPPLPEKKMLGRMSSSDSEPKVKGYPVTAGSSPQLSLSSSALSLQALLNGGGSRESVYARLGGLYGECVRRLAVKCEERFTHNHKHTHRFFNENEWSLFKLSCSKAVCVSADAAYYPASCSSDTHTPYAIKICKGHTPEVRRTHLFGLSVQQSLPSHFNLQQDCGHFIACVPQSMLPGKEEALAPAPPTSPSCHTPSDQQERMVVITRDVPSQSVGAFVSECEAFHRANPEVYERRVCFLLLQLCNGLEHLKAHGVTHRDLCLENLLLVPLKRPATGDSSVGTAPNEPLPRLIISNFSKAKRRCETDEKQRAEFIRVAPEIVSASQYRKFDEFQTGILIYEMLHLPNPFEAVPSLRASHYRIQDLPSIPPSSIYSSGLERLACLLLRPDPDHRVHISEAKRALQGLLWGPRQELMDRIGDRKELEHETLLNWLDVKRALLMMKFAERSLELDRGAELEDWLCCQYFSSAQPPALLHTAHMMYSPKTSP